MYLGPSPLFADRDIATVLERLDDTISFLQRSYAEPLFLATAVRVGQRMGIYARDYNARSGYRRRLERLGMEFARSPFTRLTPEAYLEAEGFDIFRPSFAVSEAIDEPDAGVHAVSRGLLLTQVAMLRMGRMGGRDLGGLAAALSEAAGVGSAQPAELFDHLTR